VRACACICTPAVPSISMRCGPTITAPQSRRSLPPCICELCQGVYDDGAAVMQHLQYDTPSMALDARSH
jgi:hypothetical protein